MKVIKIHRTTMCGMTVVVRECPTIWVVSSTNRTNTSVERRCAVHYKKSQHKTISKLAAHIIGDEVGVYEYVNGFGATMRVRCTYKEYLYLKLNYGADGLSEEEYEIYKNL
ncbi:MAG: hypothetical protein II260_05260 [Muribaculaceae bacterium]|nr:hypothetical protein [Muribaculaceae bacterium]